MEKFCTLEGMMSVWISSYSLLHCVRFHVQLALPSYLVSFDCNKISDHRDEKKNHRTGLREGKKLQTSVPLLF